MSKMTRKTKTMVPSLTLAVLVGLTIHLNGFAPFQQMVLGEETGRAVASPEEQARTLLFTVPLLLAPPFTGSPSFNLVPVQNGADDNGLLLNPQWGWQEANPNSLPDPMECYEEDTFPPDRFGATRTIRKPTPWVAPCSTQVTTADSAPICNWWAGGGHRNWAPATYEGTIYWKSRSSWPGDDDYNFGLLTPAAGFDTNGKPLGVGMTKSNNLNRTTGVTELKLEFDSSETINYFQTPWWVSFRKAVDDVQQAAFQLNNASPLNRPRLQEELEKRKDILYSMVDGKFAIVTGLFGVDCAHECRSESHPVWAMAIRVKEDPSDETWEIFVRRWGNEGYCSEKQHYLANLPNDTYTFRLPWSPGASSGQVIQETMHSRFGQATLPPITFSRNQGVLVPFTLPVPQSGNGEAINGELHVRWAGAAAVGPPVTTRAVPAPEEQEDEAESRLGELVKTMTPAQRAAFMEKIPPKTISQDRAALRRAGPPSQVPSLPTRVLRSAPGQVRSVPDAQKRAENQQRLDALHAVYGPNIPGFPPQPR